MRADISEPQLADQYLRLRISGNQVEATGTAEFYRGLRQEKCARPDVPFVEWCWKNNALHLSNDRYGFFPLFYSITEDGPAQELLLSPSLLTLLRKGARRDLDWRALAVFLRLNNFVGADTPFKHVRLLPPSASVQLRNGRFHVEGNLPVFREDRGLTREAALDGYIELFRKGIDSMPAEGAVVPLSGGRDSRHILLELARRKSLPLRAETIRLEPSQAAGDPVAATQLAGRLDVPHKVVAITRDPVRRERQKNLWVHWMTLEHRWLLPSCNQTRAPGTSIYEGVAGDTLSTSWHITPAFIKLLEAGKLRELASQYMPSEHYLGSLLPTEIYHQASLEVAVDRLAEEIGLHTQNPNPLGSFHVFNRTRRVTALAPSSLWRLGGSVWCPYLFAPLFDFLRSVPLSHLIGSPYHQFHTDAIARGYPEFAGIPYADKAVRSLPARRFNWRIAVELGRYATFQPAHLLRRSFLTPRIVRALLDPIYVSSMSAIMPLAVYMIQLEALHDGRWADI